MQIDTQKTVQKTLDKYRWDDLEKWQKDSLGGFSRDVYRCKDLLIRQQMQGGCQSVCFETPECTMYVSSGKHPDMMTLGQSKDVKYHCLSITTTLGERKLYQSLVDESGYMNITGDRRFILNFLEKTPDEFFVLDKDENAKHISSCYMRPQRIIHSVRPRHRLIDKERG